MVKKSVKKVDKNIPYDFASYIFGVMSIVFAFLSDAGLGGIVFGIIGLVLAKKSNTPLAKKGKKLSTIGLVLGLIILALTIGLMIYAIKVGLQAGAY